MLTFSLATIPRPVQRWVAGCLAVIDRRSRALATVATAQITASTSAARAKMARAIAMREEAALEIEAALKEVRIVQTHVELAMCLCERAVFHCHTHTHTRTHTQHTHTCVRTASQVENIKLDVEEASFKERMRVEAAAEDMISESNKAAMARAEVCGDAFCD
jgi:hypothetical protein